MCQNTQEKIGVQYEKLSQEELIFVLQLAAAREESIRPKKVTIPSAEIERIREVLRVFGPYIKNHHFFDILVSSKFGVVRLDIEGEYSFFYDADGLCLGLVDDIFDDVRESEIVQEHTDIMILPQEESELRRRISPVIEQLQDQIHYRELFQDFLREHQG